MDRKPNPRQRTVPCPAGLVGGMTNMISFGLAPINGEIAKGSFTTITKGIIKAGFDDAAMNIATGSLIATGATWIIRTTSNDFQATYHE